MFDLTPFDRNERKLMNLFDRFDRDFFGNFDQSLAAFRTDIVDKGDLTSWKPIYPALQRKIFILMWTATA